MAGSPAGCLLGEWCAVRLQSGVATMPSRFVICTVRVLDAKGTALNVSEGRREQLTNVSKRGSAKEAAAAGKLLRRDFSKSCYLVGFRSASGADIPLPRCEGGHVLRFTVDRAGERAQLPSVAQVVRRVGHGGERLDWGVDTQPGPLSSVPRGALREGRGVVQTHSRPDHQRAVKVPGWG